MKKITKLSPNTKLKSWHICESCGDQIFPNCDKGNWMGITVMSGKCPFCNKKATLIPYSDWGGYGD